jgi:hypothetical protein
VLRWTRPPARPYGLRKDSDAFIDFAKQPKVGCIITIGSIRDFSAPPHGDSSLVIKDGVRLTFVTSGATRNQANIGDTLVETLENLASMLNASPTAVINRLRYSTCERTSGIHRLLVSKINNTDTASILITTNVVGAKVSLVSERAAYVARFAQLRLYPTVIRTYTWVPPQQNLTLTAGTPALSPGRTRVPAVAEVALTTTAPTSDPVGQWCPMRHG